MGCDINLFAESRKDADAPWEFLPAPPGDCPYRAFDGDPNRPGYAKDWPGLQSWFDDRSYTLFGALADVRNNPGARVEPILPKSVVSPEGVPHTRGWPTDCCPELEAESEDIEHTPSWLTVKEMQDYFLGLALVGVDRHLPNSFETCLREMLDVSGRAPENVRAVFYFDS